MLCVASRLQYWCAAAGLYDACLYLLLTQSVTQTQGLCSNSGAVAEKPK